MRISVWCKIGLIWGIRGYRSVVSPILPPTCRYTPTCSQYALEAVQRYGPLRGTQLAIRRILRCHPFHPGGYDPVPQGLWQLGETRLDEVISQKLPLSETSEIQTSSPQPKGEQ